MAPRAHQEYLVTAHPLGQARLTEFPASCRCQLHPQLQSCCLKCGSSLSAAQSETAARAQGEHSLLAPPLRLVAAECLGAFCPTELRSLLQRETCCSHHKWRSVALKTSGAEKVGAAVVKSACLARMARASSACLTLIEIPDASCRSLKGCELLWVVHESL